MDKFLIIWLIISILSGLFLKVKINGEYTKGLKRFVIAFIVGFPFAIIILLFITMFVPMIIILVAVCLIFGTVKVIKK